MLRDPVVHLQALLLLAIVLGGGGIVYGLRHMVVQLAALSVLALNGNRVALFWRNGPRALVALVLASMAVPLLQAVPLPAGIWQVLPGRDLVVQSRLATGLDPDGWFSFSLDPLRSLVAFCSTLAPAAMIAVGSTLDAGSRRRLAMTLVAVALAGLVLGAYQLGTGNTSGLLQAIDHPGGVLFGFFSNRNSGAMLFLLGMLAVLGLRLPAGPVWPLAAAVTAGLLAIGVVLTQSRSGISLLLLPASFLAWRLLAKLRQPRPDRRARGALVAAGAAGAVLAAALIGSAVSGGRAEFAIDRFATIQTDRLEMWSDATYSVARYWPAGAGTGTFDEVFQIDESLEHVSPARAGRAHNDYLELAIDNGLPGLVLMACWWCWCLLAVIRRRRDDDRWQARAAWTGLICLALQSTLDYPLRSEALLCVAGLLIAMLAPLPRAPENGR